MPKINTDYSKTIIYKLVKNDDYNNEHVYVGSTTDFTCRKNAHKYSCCNENNKKYNLNVYKYIRDNGGWNEWKMIEIENFPCENKRKAEAREQYWMCQFKSKLNSMKSIITKEEKEEYNKQYRIDNADKLKKLKKQWCIDNAEKLKEQKKQYQIDNADKIKEKLNCDCGGKYTYSYKSKHVKTKKHLNYLHNL